MALEAHQALSVSGFENIGSTLLMRSVGRTALDKERGASWYNDDVHFQQAVGEVMVAKGEVLESKALCKLMGSLLNADERLEGAQALGRMIEFKSPSTAEARREARSLLRRIVHNDGFGVAKLRAAGVSATACVDGIGPLHHEWSEP